MEDYTNYRLGHLLVLNKVGENKLKQSLWLCKCDCGNYVKLRNVTIRKGVINTCCDKCPYNDDLNLVGKRFGYITVVDMSYMKERRYWVCKCDCGKTIIRKGNCLKSGNTKSCGCMKGALVSQNKKKHDHCGEKIYIIWIAMKGRCYNKNNISYKNYGKRGITVCEEWKNNFMAFYDWAYNNGYKEGLSIDRIDFNVITVQRIVDGLQNNFNKLIKEIIDT